MEVAKYMSLGARLKNLFVFKCQVLCSYAFDFDSFVRVMRSIFGEKVVFEFFIV